MSCPKPTTGTMCGWVIPAIALISRLNRSMKSESDSLSAFGIFTTTGTSRSLSHAR